MKIFTLVFAVATISLVCISAAAQSNFDVKKLDGLFDSLETNDRMMGSVVLAKDGKVIYSRAFGYRDYSAKEKIKSDADTMFRIGSITKPFTAVLIFRLIEEKKLTLDTKLSKFFPQIANADKITVAHLLSHTSGLANFPQGVNYDDPKSWVFQPQTKDEMLARFTPVKPIFSPGERRQYSNTNFALLGYIVEAVTGSPYSQYLSKNIAKKAGLKRTRSGGKVDSLNNEAHSFNWDEGKWNQNSEEDLSIAGGSGSMVSSSADLAKFIHTLFSTNKIIGEKSQKEMVTPFLEKFENSTKGIGVGVTEIGSLKKKIFHHDGGIDGFSSLLTYVPEDHVALSITVNGQNYPINKVWKTVLKIYYDQAVELPVFKEIKLPAETLNQYEGSYTFKEIGMTITIKKGEANLIAQATGQDAFPIEPISETSFADKKSGIIIEFTKNVDGSISRFTLYQGRNVSAWEKEKLL